MLRPAGLWEGDLLGPLTTQKRHHRMWPLRLEVHLSSGKQESTGACVAEEGISCSSSVGKGRIGCSRTVIQSQMASPNPAGGFGGGVWVIITRDFSCKIILRHLVHTVAVSLLNKKQDPFNPQAPHRPRKAVPAAGMGRGPAGTTVPQTFGTENCKTRIRSKRKREHLEAGQV